MKKRGLSGVVTTVLLIGLSIALIAVIWIVINNLVNDKLNRAAACADAVSGQKATLDNDYTCYDRTNQELKVAVSIGDADIESVKILVSDESNTNSYNLDKTSSTGGVKLLSGGPAKLPNRNSGYTYVISNILVKPDQVKVIPTIGGYQCEVSDIIPSIDYCELLI